MAVSIEVATQRRPVSRRRASAGSRKATVEPVPRPDAHAALHELRRGFRGGLLLGIGRHGMRRYPRRVPAVFDIEQAILLLELEPPFDKRDVQLARRRLAKVWHPDLAPPGKQFEHERHLKAINLAADQLEELAEGSRGGKISRNAVKVNAAAARAARAEEGRRAYEREQAAREAAADRARNDPFGDRMPDHSVVHRYARCLSYPEWGVGTVSGIYFTGAEDNIQQWARVAFQVGVRTVPAGSLQFVDFSKPDPGAERVQRFMTAAQHAMAEGDYRWPPSG